MKICINPVWAIARHSISDRAWRVATVWIPDAIRPYQSVRIRSFVAAVCIRPSIAQLRSGSRSVSYWWPIGERSARVLLIAGFPLVAISSGGRTGSSDWIQVEPQLGTDFIKLFKRFEKVLWKHFPSTRATVWILRTNWISWPPIQRRPIFASSLLQAKRHQHVEFRSSSRLLARRTHFHLRELKLAKLIN